MWEAPFGQNGLAGIVGRVEIPHVRSKVLGLMV